MIDTDQKQEAAKFSQTNAANATQCATPAQGCSPAQGYSPAPIPLAAQLGRRVARGNEELGDLYRAHDILLRHPEYEELLWLFRSGLV